MVMASTIAHRSGCRALTHKACVWAFVLSDVGLKSARLQGTLVSLLPWR